MVKCWNSGFEAVIKSVEAPMIDFYTDCIKNLARTLGYSLDHYLYETYKEVSMWQTEFYSTKQAVLKVLCRLDKH